MIHGGVRPCSSLAAARLALVDRLALTRTNGVATWLAHHRLTCHPALIYPLNTALLLDVIEASSSLLLPLQNLSYK